jgi:hypothetical protein
MKHVKVLVGTVLGYAVLCFKVKAGKRQTPLKQKKKIVLRI